MTLEEIQAGYERWTRRTMVILAVLAVVQLLLGVLAIYLLDQNGQRSDQARREEQVRTGQFCLLINGTHDDRARRYENTLVYLRSPAGRERTLFNDYIRRIALPQTRQELRQEAERLPAICRQRAKAG